MVTPTLEATAQGLSSEEAARRLLWDGPNEIPQEVQRGIVTLVMEVLKEPIFLLLVGACAICFLLGDVQEALMLLSFVALIIAITVYQQRKTENAMQALRNLPSPRVLVIRGGTRIRIAGREVVTGDLLLLLLSEGDRVPADARVRESLNLVADESLLTGEPVPVNKFPRAAEEKGDNQAALR